MSRWFFEKIKEKAQQIKGSKGQILKRADGKPFRRIAWADAREIGSKSDLEGLARDGFVLIRKSRGGTYLEW